VQLGGKNRRVTLAELEYLIAAGQRQFALLDGSKPKSAATPAPRSPRDPCLGW
jgi:hypothetical protein